MSIENPNEVNEDAALDAELAKSIAEVNAGKTLVETPGQTGATGPSEESNTGATGTTGPEDTGATGEANGKPQADEKKEEPDFRIPNKGKFESDEAYEKRVELFDLVKRRKAAVTPEAKKALSEEISKTKGELRTLGESDKHYKQPEKETPADGATEDPTVVADRERAKALGLASKEDIQQMMADERLQLEVKSDLQKFVDKYKDLQDPDVREVFFDFVDKNYVWQGKSGKELITTLEMARENMFRPSETIQDRVLKAANVHEKVNAMQFPGGTGDNKAAYSPEMKKSIDELKATGMSEEKAVELLSD